MSVSEDQPSEGLEWVREYSLGYYGRIIDTFDTLGQYVPETMVQWIKLRKSIFDEESEGGLTTREKELIATAIEIIARKPDSGPHARLAIKAGATPKQVAEVCSLCILLGGMVSHMSAGQHALKAAEDEYRRLKGEG